MMKPHSSNTPRLLLVALFALACFSAGYLAPHGHVALAQAPKPQCTNKDNVPGGIGGHGDHATISNAISIAGSKGWPCAQGETCYVEFQVQMALKGTPTPYPCAQQQPNCLTFEGKGFSIESRDPNATQYPNVNVAGRIQLVKQ
jgi:hypothetical protein